MSTRKPLSAALYCRISQDREGAGLGVERQERECRDLAERLGWEVVEVFVDNDISASTGKRRPAYERLLAALDEGRIRGVLAWHPDRLHRRPNELERFIDTVSRTGAAVQTVTAGEVDLSTSTGRMTARVVGAVARAESERMGERVAAARAQAATAGKWQGGIRPFGFDDDGVTLRPSEAAEIRKATDSILGGGSLRGVVLDLNGRGIATSHGKQWHSRTLRDMLVRPRNAGQLVYKGEVTGTAPWPAIVTADERLRLLQLFDDPARRTSPGNQVKWLGSGLFWCGICGSQRIVCNTSGGARPGQTRYPAYRCGAREAAPGRNHLVRHQANVDAVVVGAVIERLSRDDLRTLVRPRGPGLDVPALTAELQDIGERRTELAKLYGLRKVRPADYALALAGLDERAGEIERALGSAPTASPLAPLVAAGDVEAMRAVWDGFDLGRRRAVIGELMTVTLLPSGSRGPVFDPESVRIEWRGADD